MFLHAEYGARLALCPAQKWVQLYYVGDFHTAVTTVGACYWFGLNLGPNWKRGEDRLVPGTACVSRHRPDLSVFNGGIHTFPEPFDTPHKEGDWERMLDFAPRLFQKLHVDPLYDWMMESMPEPWCQWPADPLGVCRKVCPFTLSGDLCHAPRS